MSVWPHVQLPEQTRPWDTLACCWDVKQPTNKQTSPTRLRRSLYFASENIQSMIAVMATMKTITDGHDTSHFLISLHPWLRGGQAKEVSAAAPRLLLVCLFVGCLLNVPATSECISGTDLLRQFHVLPLWDRSCRSNFLPHTVTVYWHRADQSQRWPYNARRLAG